MHVSVVDVPFFAGLSRLPPLLQMEKMTDCLDGLA
jgi:hypothetical protein